MAASKNVKVGFIGSGRLARALAVGLSQRGYPVAAVTSRTPDSAKSLASLIKDCKPVVKFQDVADICDIVFITTPDDDIAQVESLIKWRNGIIVVHCSGAESSHLLSNAKTSGASVATFHPMQTFSGYPDEHEKLANVAFALDGDKCATDTLEKLAYDLGGWPVFINPELRSLYHISGFLACGAVSTLLSESIDLWNLMGYSKEDALRVLLPILRSTVSNIEKYGPASSLTGPVSRGDVGTVSRHIDALNSKAPDLLGLYRQLSISAVSLSKQLGGIDDKQESDLFEILNAQSHMAKLPSKKPVR